MDPDFWPDAIRDLALLLAGGLLTILGGWIAARQSERRAEDDRRHEAEQAARLRERQAVESAREIIFQLYVTARAQQEAGETARVKFEQDVLLDAEARVYLVPDADIREVINGSLRALRGLGAAIENGTLHGNPERLQVQVLFASIQILSAIVRGDEAPSRYVERLREIGTATRDAWTELIRQGQAKEV